MNLFRSSPPSPSEIFSHTPVYQKLWHYTSHQRQELSNLNPGMAVFVKSIFGIKTSPVVFGISHFVLSIRYLLRFLAWYSVSFLAIVLIFVFGIQYCHLHSPPPPHTHTDEAFYNMSATVSLQLRLSQSLAISGLSY